ncbi:MAG: redoxin domain-containing protein [Acidobacteriia bacterium]|nr:redoxin domain-containing protein [Terriglobia bacterium]
MRRSWDWRIWVGFGTALFAAFSYIPIFSRFPITRDFPWANLVLFLVAACLLAVGLHRAFAQAERYRGKISGSILGALSLLIFGLFCYGALYETRNIPSAESALRVGQRAPDFSLAGVDGKPVTLSQLRQGKRFVLLIFYRGYW